MNIEHTPGPWNFDEFEGTLWVTDDTSIGTIAKVIPSNVDGSLNEDKANARLIASAPDLLQVVEDYVLLCDLHDYVGSVPDSARAALRKAKGEAK